MSVQQAAVRQASAPATRSEKRGLAGSLFRLLLWIVGSLVVSILVEWVGMTWWWPEQGARHARDMLEAEIGYLASGVRTSLVVEDTQAYARTFADAGYEWLWRRTGLEALADSAARPPAPDAGTFRRWAHRLWRAVGEYVVAASHITQLFFVRIAVLSLSMPAFLLAAFMGLLDGAVQRDLRRWGGGRESSFVYHHARRLIWPAFIAAWVIYLSMPVSVHPSLVVIPFAAATGLVIAVTVASFKKYL